MVELNCLEFIPASPAVPTQLAEYSKVKVSRIDQRRSSDILGAASSMCKGLSYKMKTTLSYLVNYGRQGAL